MSACDVLVVGAGPAGSIAALVLARAGVRVRLIDRAEFPRDKLCGDTVNPGALSILDRLGVGEPVRAGGLPIGGMVVTGPGGARVASAYPHGLRGAAIARRDLDMMLVEAAVRAGADFAPGAGVRAPLLDGSAPRVTGVELLDAAQAPRLHARVVVAADGRRSRLAGAVGLSRFARAPKRWAYGAYFTGVTGLGPHGEMHIRPGGYLGIAPLPGGVANVCVVTEPRPSPQPRRDPGFAPADDVVAQAIAGDASIAARFAGARRLGPVTVLGPLAVEAAGAGRPGLLLAGDAAGFVDPMTGDGLRFALRGGELAAEAALRELTTGAPAFASLQEARRREFAGKWRVNRALRALVASPHGVRLAAAIAGRWSAPVRGLIGIAGDVPLARRAAKACAMSS